MWHFIDTVDTVWIVATFGVLLAVMHASARVDAYIESLRKRIRELEQLASRDDT